MMMMMMGVVRVLVCRLGLQRSHVGHCVATPWACGAFLRVWRPRATGSWATVIQPLIDVYLYTGGVDAGIEQAPDVLQQCTFKCALESVCTLIYHTICILTTTHGAHTASPAAPVASTVMGTPSPARSFPPTLNASDRVRAGYLLVSGDDRSADVMSSEPPPSPKWLALSPWDVVRLGERVGRPAGEPLRLSLPSLYRGLPHTVSAHGPGGGLAVRCCGKAVAETCPCDASSNCNMLTAVGVKFPGGCVPVACRVGTWRLATEQTQVHRSTRPRRCFDGRALVETTRCQPHPVVGNDQRQSPSVLRLFS